MINSEGRGSSPTFQTMTSRTISDFSVDVSKLESKIYPSSVLNSNFLSSCTISILLVEYCDVWAKQESFFCVINKIENSISLEDGHLTILGRNFLSESPFQFTSNSPSSWNFKMSPRSSRKPLRKKGLIKGLIPKLR